MVPAIAPCTADSSVTGSSAGQPSHAPIAAISQTSPQPMVSRLRIFSPNKAIAAKAAKPAAAPIAESIQRTSRFQSGETSPTASSGQVIWCGSSQVSRSM